MLNLFLMKPAHCLRIAYALQYEYKYEYEYEYKYKYEYECVIPHSGGMRMRRAVSAKERKMNFRFCFLVRASRHNHCLDEMKAKSLAR